jgi:hypothetical protein
VQGCLRKEELSATLETSCAHCGETFAIDIDSAGRCRSDGGAPLLFEPRIDWEHFTKPNIIDDF